jgi:hypothetical protein
MAPEAEARPLYDEANELVGIFITSVRRLRGAQVLANIVVTLLVVLVVLTFAS